MTAYFDAIGTALLRARQLDERVAYDRLREIEEGLVYDVTLCFESPGFPADLRERGHRIVLAHGVHTRPVNDLTHPTIESLVEAYAAVSSMASDLHDLFHAVCRRETDEGLAGFSDDPRSPMRVLFTRGEQFREDLAAASKRAL